MKCSLRRAWPVLPLFLTLALAVVAGASPAPRLAPELRDALATTPDDRELPVIVRLAGQADLRPRAAEARAARRTRLINALKETAERSQQGVRSLLRESGARPYRPLWIINGLAVAARPDVIRALASRPEVAQIELDAVISLLPVQQATAASAEWNIDAVGAPEVWARGSTGQGVVVASMDSGVDISHPDVGPAWRGGSNSWLDPSGEHPTPADLDGHGTAVMGVMVGGSAGGTSIGVVPGARWIAVKIFNDAGSAPLSGIHEGFQWLLDPDGDPVTDDAPDVVNNSWGFEEASGQCIDMANPNPDFNTDFHDDIQVLKAAGIAVVFAAGNAGPNAATSVSPANYPEGFAAGAVDQNGTVAFTSSRGPSACDGTLFPEVVAPGVGVKIADLTLGGTNPVPYDTLSGTSFSAPHVAGVMALLRGAFPGISVEEMESVLETSAKDLGPTGPDNDYGHGLIDAARALRQLSTASIGVFRSGRWYLDADGDGAWNAGSDILHTPFGLPGDLPVAGDWDGESHAGIGVFRGGRWYLDADGNGLWNPAVDRLFASFGLPGDRPVAGDWNGDGRDEIGVFRGGKWYLDANGNGAWDVGADIRHNGFGLTGDLPVAGDWNGDGRDEIGVFRGGKWYLDANGNGVWEPASDVLCTFGLAGDLPVAGDWDGDGRSQIAVIRAGKWYLDASGNGQWDAANDISSNFGLAGDLPLSGRWQHLSP